MGLLNDSLKEMVQEVMSIDPLLEAEKITGQDYKASQDTTMLGFAIMQKVNQEKQALLTMLHDTHMRITYREFQDIAIHAGFIPIYQEDIPDPEYKNIFQMWWNKDKSILMRSESYFGKSEEDRGSVNSAEIYYSWKPNDNNDRGNYTSSGHFVDPNNPQNRLDIKWEACIWQGNHDVREGLNLIIERLSNHGTFMKTWVEFPFIWLLNYMEPKKEGYNHKEITDKKISTFPKEIQQAMRFID